MGLPLWSWGSNYNTQHTRLRMKPWLRQVDALAYILVQMLGRRWALSILAAQYHSCKVAIQQHK